MNTSYYTQNANTLLVCIDGKSISSTSTLWHEFNRLLEFPNYFGFNFDAFEEMMHDLSWISAKHVILYFYRMDALLSDPMEQENKALFLEIIHSCNNSKLDIVFSDSNNQSSLNV